eukprot:1161998-Pelagomonas_calceolata.AAC.3
MEWACTITFAAFPEIMGQGSKSGPKKSLNVLFIAALSVLLRSLFKGVVLHYLKPKAKCVSYAWNVVVSAS